MDFDRMLRRVRRTYPAMDADEQREIAADWMAEWAEEYGQREDSPCIEDTLPEEVIALRRELRETT